MVHCSAPLTSSKASQAAFEEQLREVCNVSAVIFTESAESAIRVQPAGELGRVKCERCWHWENDVGHNPAHPTLCARCAEAVTTALA
ncbi:MAG TPA: zinc finger domain-containing protein [Candidatus Limnocylindria bacterium]|nr:zinc finger domain-containing protein [Candidatus Limnocylindria bacterium]